MNYKMIGRFIAQILSIEGVFMIPALCISMGYGQWNAAASFAAAMAAIVAVAAVLFLLCRHAPNALDAREGMVCVGISWIVLSLFGCLPFWFSREIPRYIDAFFEIVSGFTTTGSSILSDVEALTPGILYWRSFSHWLGGMGVLVFLLAVAPGSKDKGFTMHLLRAESPGPDVGKLVPKMRKTASILYLIYVGMTVVNIIFLLLGDMHWLEALCTAFGTAGTGGFGIRNDSLASYSPYIQYVTTVFMFLFGVNFSCYY
jgi:trk system potassium uptake protein TrkH